MYISKQNDISRKNQNINIIFQLEEKKVRYEKDGRFYEFYVFYWTK